MGCPVVPFGDHATIAGWFTFWPSPRLGTWWLASQACWTCQCSTSAVGTEREIELRDALATQAKKAGLFDPEALERMVREALLARRVEDLVQARDVLTTNSLPPMTPEEIQAEIDAYRAEVRRAARP